MRQTGRTSRIANFAIDQLYSVGEVIITDHIAFEGFDTKQTHLSNLIDKVKDGFGRTHYSNDWQVKHEIHKVGETPVVRFKLERKPELRGKEWM